MLQRTDEYTTRPEFNILHRQFDDPSENKVEERQRCNLHILCREKVADKRKICKKKTSPDTKAPHKSRNKEPPTMNRRISTTVRERASQWNATAKNERRPSNMAGDEHALPIRLILRSVSSDDNGRRAKGATGGARGAARHITSAKRQVTRGVHSPSGHLEALDELLDFPYFDVAVGGRLLVGHVRAGAGREGRSATEAGFGSVERSARAGCRASSSRGPRRGGRVWCSACVHRRPPRHAHPHTRKRKLKIKWQQVHQSRRCVTFLYGRKKW